MQDITVENHTLENLFTQEKLRGRLILSKYGMVCVVKNPQEGPREAGAGEKITCYSIFSGKTWELPVNEISLITKDNFILSPTGEIYGDLFHDCWTLYSEKECRMITPEELEKEFN